MVSIECVDFYDEYVWLPCPLVLREIRRLPTNTHDTHTFLLRDAPDPLSLSWL